MKKLLFLLSILSVTPFCNIESANSAEPWKGVTQTSPYELGMMTGLSLYGTQTAWGFLFDGAYLVKPKGWVDDVDNRVWVEVQMGPSFFSSTTNKASTGMQYSTHLRWDFTYNELWTAYALGGLSGYVLPSSLGSGFSIHPRFGVGVEYQTKIIAEFMGVGIALNF